MYLLDTNALSELRRPRPHGAVVAWLRSVPDHMVFVPAIAIDEIQLGIEATATQDPAKAREISAWLDGILPTSQIIDATPAIFRTWARLIAKTRRDLLVDALVASTAIETGMSVATRNIRDFAAFEVECLNPFEWQG